MMKIVKFLLLFCSIFLYSSCAEDHHTSNVSLEEFKKHVKEDEEKSVGKLNIWDMALPVVEDDELRLQAGDLISISVFGLDELNAKVRINSRGNVSVPLLNQVNLAGLTAAEAEEKVETLLKVDFMHDPHVTLIVEEMVGQEITIVGALNHPGTFEIKSKKTILDVIALAEGLAKNSSDVAYVTRSAGDSSGSKVFLVNLYQLMSKGKVDMNIPVKGGDVIFIPEAGVVSVDGAVRKPGSVYLDGEMTVSEALAAAGGLAKYADLEDIKLIRVLDDGKRQVVQLSLNEIEGVGTSELLLKENDIIYAEASGTKVFTTGFGFDLKVLGTGVSYDNPVN